MEQIATNRPRLLNLLVAYFVMEWQQVRNGATPHGVDQTGVTCVIPDYVGMWGVDECVALIKDAPATRDAGEPGLLSQWATEISNAD